MATTNALTNYGENLVCNYLFRGATTTVPTVYLALFTADPTETGSLASEVTGGGYARVNITAGGGFTAPSNGSVSNAATLEFPTATENWGTMTYTAVMDAATGGNMICRSELTVPRELLAGDSARFLAGALTYSID